MVEITAKSPKRRVRSLLGTPAQDLFLLVRGTEHGGQVVRLSASKCTVGSGKTCTLRLRSAGVRAVHCLIFRGQRATFVRRFDENTRLNGRLFDSAPLAVGDRLAVGPVELEIIDEPTARRLARRSPPAVLQRTGPGNSAPLRQVVEQTRQQADLLRSSLAKTRHAATRRVQQLTEQLRSARERLHRLQAEFHGDRERTRCVQEALADQQAQLERQFEQRRRELETDLKRRQAELESQAADVETQAAELAERKRQLAQGHAERQGELDALQRQLTQRCEQIERQRAEAESGSSHAQATLEADAEKFEEQTRQFEAERAAWQQERQRYDDELRERTVLLERRQADLAENDQELAAVREELDSLKEELQQQRRAEMAPDPQQLDAADPPQFDAAAPGFATVPDEPFPLSEERDAAKAHDPVSLPTFVADDSLAGGQTQNDHGTSPDAFLPPDAFAPPDAQAESPDALAVSAPPEPLVPYTPPVPGPASSPGASAPGETGTPAGKDGDHDESVEEYMAGLMKRLRGETATSPETDDAPYVATGQRNVEEEPPAAVEIETAPESAAEEPLAPSEYRPRNSAPESKTDLGVLREVANTSARSAIDCHTQKRSGKGAFGKIVRAGLAVLAAVSFGCWQSALGPVALAGAAISLVAASLWIAQAAHMLSLAFLARQAPRGGRVEESLPAGE